MSWLTEAWDAIIDVAEEIPIVSGLVDGGRAIAEFAPGFIDEVGEVLSSPIDTVVDGAEFVGETLAGFGALVLSPLAVAGDVIGAAAGYGADALDTVTFGGASWLTDQVDEYVFDNVDWVTGGAIDIDFDNGAFSVDLGMNELASVGFSIGEQGFTTDGYLGGVGAGIGATTDDGFTVDVKADLPFLDEVGVGVGLDLDDGGDDAFFLDIDGRVLPDDNPPDDDLPDDDPPGSTVPDAGGEVTTDPAVAVVAADDVGGEIADSGDGRDFVDVADAAFVTLEAPDEWQSRDDAEFAMKVDDAAAVEEAANDIWNDLG
ncbi:MAG: hypothetical protein Q7V88_06880 [Actinomycetota bacterium]|nr:hypothetical protein [Actinomycetota bacterium]